MSRGMAGACMVLLLALGLPALAWAAEPKKFAGMRMEDDKIEATVRYTDASSPRHTGVNAFYAYTETYKSRTSLRLRLQYAGDAWLYLHDGVIVADDERLRVPGRWTMDFNRPGVEWGDMTVTKLDLPVLRKIAAAKSVTVRYYGRQYHSDRKVTAAELKALGRVLAVYDQLVVGEPPLPDKFWHLRPASRPSAPGPCGYSGWSCPR